MTPLSGLPTSRRATTKSLPTPLSATRVDGLTDEETMAQLSGILYEIDSQGRMKIESQEKARERGAPSSDRAEALMLALWKAAAGVCVHPGARSFTPRSRDGGISMGDDDQSSGRAWRVRGG
jgi:hypothetical protein